MKITDLIEQIIQIKNKINERKKEYIEYVLMHVFTLEQLRKINDIVLKNENGHSL
jgi:hypothetical protein